MLLVFLGLLVFLLSLLSIAIQLRRDAGIFVQPPIAVIAIVALVIPGGASAQTTSPDQSSPAAPLPNEPPETPGRRPHRQNPTLDGPSPGIFYTTT